MRPGGVQETREAGSRYDTLLQVTVGQEEVEDIIFRDIHRTFPQHPRFLLGQGQEELFNVLKAYSMIDMEARACLPYHSTLVRSACRARCSG